MSNGEVSHNAKVKSAGVVQTKKELARAAYRRNGKKKKTEVKKP